MKSPQRIVFAILSIACVLNLIVFSTLNAGIVREYGYPSEFLPQLVLYLSPMVLLAVATALYGGPRFLATITAVVVLYQLLNLFVFVSYVTDSHTHPHKEDLLVMQMTSMLLILFALLLVAFGTGLRLRRRV